MGSISAFPTAKRTSFRSATSTGRILAAGSTMLGVVVVDEMGLKRDARRYIYATRNEHDRMKTERDSAAAKSGRTFVPRLRLARAAHYKFWQADM